MPCGDAASSERPVACLAWVSAVAAAAVISSWQAAASSVPRGASQPPERRHTCEGLTSSSIGQQTVPPYSRRPDAG